MMDVIEVMEIIEIIALYPKYNPNPARKIPKIIFWIKLSIGLINRVCL
jgi:hypothetical protein